MSHIHCENTREPQNVNTEIIANPSVRTGRRCRARLTILAENMQINSNDFCRQLCSWPLFEKSAKTNDGKIILSKTKYKSGAYTTIDNFLNPFWFWCAVNGKQAGTSSPLGQLST